MQELLLCCALRRSHSRLFLRASVLLSTASTLPSVQPPTFVRFLTFLYWVLSLSYFSYFAVSYFSYSLSPFFLHKLMCFLILSWIPFTWWSLRAKGCQFFCLLFYCLLVFNLRQCFSSYMNGGTPLCFALRCSHSRLFCALRCCLLLLQFCLLFNEPRSSAFSPFSIGFCHFRVFHTS